MFRRISFVLVWVVAAVAATGIVFAAVSSVAGDVVERPGPVLEAALDVEDVPRQVGEDSVSTTSPSTPSTATSPSPSTSSPSTSTSVTSTSVASTSGATTSSLAAGNTKTFRLVGGWVRVAHASGVVTLDAAAPNSGFTMDVKQSGPDEVEVEFRGNDHRSSVEVEWAGGQLVGEVEERPD